MGHKASGFGAIMWTEPRFEDCPKRSRVNATCWCYKPYFRLRLCPALILLCSPTLESRLTVPVSASY
eukprot:1158743-Pelagomonas_calceolata.AAC.37